MENWKSVVGYEGVYEVSDHGRVKRISLPSGKPLNRLLKQSISKQGYLVVGLCLNSKPKVFGVHRLVAFSFIGEPPSNRHVVAHNDGNKKNNALNNLRWASPSENLYDTVLHGTNHGKYYGRKSHFSDLDIEEIRASNIGAKRLSEIYGVSYGTIIQILKGQTYKHLIDPSYARGSLYGTKSKDRKVRKSKNKLMVRDGYVEIELTQGYSTKVSEVDAKELRSKKWFAVKKGNTVYAFSSETNSDGKRKNIPMHRFIMNPDRGVFVDHKNGDGLDNRRDNLRLVSHAQNQRNRKNAKNNKSGYKGVSIDKRSGKYRASIGVDGKSIHLGLFTIAEDAAKVYDKASVRYHGVYGRRNFPDN